MTNGTPAPAPTGVGWVDVFARAVTTVGFPVVVAALLLYWVLFRFEHQMEIITNRMEANAKGVAEMIGALKENSAVQRQWATDNVSELRKQTEELGDQTEAIRALAARMEKHP
jgi:hypothetical protein